MGDRNLMRLVVATFAEDMGTQLASLKAATDQGDTQKAGALAHKIKGAAANVGGTALSAQAQALETAAKAGRLEIVKAGLENLDRGLSQLLEQVEQQLGT